MLGENLTLGVVIGAGLLDSINPCVFGVLIFLIAFMTRVFKSKNMMLLGGLLYTAVVYATYLLLGFGILKAALFSPTIAEIFYVIAGVIAILAGILEIKDYFWYGRWFTLEMIPGASSRLKRYTEKIESMRDKHPSVLILATAALGVFVVLVELPCTGAPYFAILGLLAQGAYTTAVPLLLLYNFIFVLPLLIVIGVVYFGMASDKVEAWRKRHRGLMRLLVGIFLLALGGYMIFSLL